MDILQKVKILGDAGKWDNYYNSQYIKERRNLKLMKQMMPKKYRNDITEERIAKRCHSLKEFV